MGTSYKVISFGSDIIPTHIKHLIMILSGSNEHVSDYLFKFTIPYFNVTWLNLMENVVLLAIVWLILATNG